MKIVDVEVQPDMGPVVRVTVYLEDGSPLSYEMSPLLAEKLTAHLGYTLQDLRADRDDQDAENESLRKAEEAWIKQQETTNEMLYHDRGYDRDE